jgi:NAD(P)H-hydrate epimerase
MMDIPAITTDQMRQVDQMMIDVYGIQLIQMMENAGRHLALLSKDRFLKGDPTDKTVLVLAGSGNNGGGGLVAARWLSNWGANVRVYTTRADADIKGVPGHQLTILRRMGLPIAQAGEFEALRPANVILDCIIGYSLNETPRGQAAHLIRLANAGEAPILSLDVPSGMDASTGVTFSPHIRATATLTLALPKTGLFTKSARASTGELYVADISVPPQLYIDLGVNVGLIFSQDEIIKIY